MDRYELVHDQKTFDTFVNEVLPELLPGEKHFVSLSARNKYLDEDERKFYELGRTEMFGRTLGTGDWKYTMAKLAANLRYKRTKAGMEFPLKSLVVYVNINPSADFKAVSQFNQATSRIMAETREGYRQGRTPNEDSLCRAERLLMDAYQQATSRRVWLDIDADTGDQSVLTTLGAPLSAHQVDHCVLKTQGGYHFMVNRESLNGSGLRLDKLVKELHQEAVVDGGEVKFNKNAMVPMPGTLQAGKLVELQWVVKY